MTPTMSALARSAVSADQHAVGFAVSEDRGFKRMRREYSIFSLRNVIRVIRNGPDEIWGLVIVSTVLIPVFMPLGFFVFGSQHIDVPPHFIVTGSFLPLLFSIGLAIHVNVDEEVLAKHKTLAATIRSAKRADPAVRPCLTSEHLDRRDKLDELLLTNTDRMTKKERAANADGVFALMLEDFENVDEVFDLMESRGLFTAEQVRAVVVGARGVSKPLREGAL